MTTISLTNAHGYFHTTATNLDMWTEILSAWSVERIMAEFNDRVGYELGYYDDITSKSEALVMWCDITPSEVFSQSKDELIALYNR